MSHPGSVTRLRSALTDAMRVGRSLEADLQVDQVANRQIWRDVARTFDAMDGRPAGPTLRDAVRSFITTGKVRNFVHLKHVCYGVTLPLDERGVRLLDRERALQDLLREVDGMQADGRRFRRCYQALVQSYFTVEVPAPKGDGALDLGEGSGILRGFLSNRLQVAARSAGGKEPPAWVLTLRDHGNLLTERPCDRYVAELQQGRTDELTRVCETLGIARDSWVWQAVILAYLAEVCARPDDRFKAGLDTALDLADGGLSLRPTKPIARLIVGTLVKRYRQAKLHPELPRLRDEAITRIGNPWLQRVQWDAWVGDEPARQMVDGWLKNRLMEDFFTLLAQQGGATDQRRLRYWLRFVPAITDMWFVLGPAATRNNTPEFLEMRERMEGRRLSLVRCEELNNAFVMRAGEHVFIEFSLKNNACFHYTTAELPFDLNARREIGLTTLKLGKRKHSHNYQWEHDFDRRFCPLIGFWPPGADKEPAPPAAPPSSPPVKRTEPTPRHLSASPQWRKQQISDVIKRCFALGIVVDDRRAKGGSLWISLRNDQLEPLRLKMELCGFRYSERHQKYYLQETE